MREGYSFVGLQEEYGDEKAITRQAANIFYKLNNNLSEVDDATLEGFKIGVFKARTPDFWDFLRGDRNTELAVTVDEYGGILSIMGQDVMVKYPTLKDEDPIDIYIGGAPLYKVLLVRGLEYCEEKMNAVDNIVRKAMGEPVIGKQRPSVKENFGLKTGAGGRK